MRGRAGASGSHEIREHPNLSLNPGRAQQTGGGSEVDLGGCALETPSILGKGAGSLS